MESANIQQPFRNRVLASLPAPEVAIQQPYKNRILASLPAAEVARLTPYLSPRVFKQNQTLHDPGQMVETVYFLEDGICSIVVTMADGSTVGVGVVGREGFVSMAALLGDRHSPTRTIIQIAGTGYAIKAKTLAEQYGNSSSQLHLYLQRSIQALLAQIAQTAACNCVHELEERLARWLLMCHGRVQTDDLPITHESLAMMLGARRSSVTVAAGNSAEGRADRVFARAREDHGLQGPRNGRLRVPFRHPCRVRASRTPLTACRRSLVLKGNEFTRAAIAVLQLV